MPCVAACCRMVALSQSLSDRPARRAASSAILRASGRTPLTLHEKSNFMPAPTSEVETPRAGLDSRGLRRRNVRVDTGLGPSSTPQLFACHGKQVVNVAQSEAR